MVFNRRCLRSMRTRTKLYILMLISIVLIYYFFVEREPILDHNLARRYGGVNLIANNRLEVQKTIQNALKKDKGTGCEMPKLDPFAPEVMQFDMDLKPIVCNGTDWVSCKFNKCSVKKRILNEVTEVKCAYRDVVRVSDDEYYLGDEKIVQGSESYELDVSDFAEVTCKGKWNQRGWKGIVMGFRDIVQSSEPLHRGREHTPNILILGFDSTSKNGFIRRMPRSYKVLSEELDSVILNGYNIVGDGTPPALFPILTGHTELELPDLRRRVGSQAHLDNFPFIWNTLKDDGYRTAFFEDSPSIGTFQYRFNGFQKQPTDHYLRHFLMQYIYNMKEYNRYGNSGFCIGDTPTHALLLNKTNEFMLLDPASKKFIFTFIVDITHDDFNLISNADVRLEQWLRDIKKNGVLDNTLLILMGDHGPRFAQVRNTLQGKQEERLPLMALVLPKSFIKKRPEALKNLKMNAEVLTTPFDIHSTLLDLVELQVKQVDVKIAGSDMTRSVSLFHKVLPLGNLCQIGRYTVQIPSNRSCSEAGIEPHWCTCLKWETVKPDDDMFQLAGNSLLTYINHLTQDLRSKCLPRTLTTIETVSRWTPNSNLLAFKRSVDPDGYLARFDAKMKISKQLFQVKIRVGPGVGIYEASMTYDSATKKFHQNTRDISRINAYNNEPSCITSERPDLNMYCYCKSS